MYKDFLGLPASAGMQLDMSSATRLMGLKRMA
jgi:hypothetical protein